MKKIFWMYMDVMWDYWSVCMDDCRLGFERK